MQWITQVVRYHCQHFVAQLRRSLGLRPSNALEIEETFALDPRLQRVRARQV